MPLRAAHTYQLTTQAQLVLIHGAPSNCSKNCSQGQGTGNSSSCAECIISIVCTYVAAPVEAVQSLLQGVAELEPQHRHQRLTRQRMGELQDHLLAGLVAA